MVYLDDPQINDLIIYEDDDSRFIARITNSINNHIHFKWLVSDLVILHNSSIDNHDKVPHVLQVDYELATRNIIKDFGNITLKELEEKYPEWLI